MKTCIKLLLAFLLFTMVGCSGDVTTYYPDGKKRSEGNLKFGKKNGLWITWYENGQKGSEVHYKNDEYDGTYISWYPNGQKAEEHYYEDGSLVGVWTWWWPNGEKKEEWQYTEGEVSHFGKIYEKKTKWDENGKKILEIQYGMVGEEIIRKEF